MFTDAVVLTVATNRANRIVVNSVSPPHGKVFDGVSLGVQGKEPLPLGVGEELSGMRAMGSASFQP